MNGMAEMQLQINELMRKPRQPFGWVALYCGHKLFTDDKKVADVYAKFCEVIPVFTFQEQSPQEQQ